MADWTATVVRMRTTSGGGVNAVGIVTGMGATPGQALAALQQQAGQLAQEAAERATKAADRAGERAAERRKRAAKEAEDRRREAENRIREELRRRMPQGSAGGIPAPARRTQPAPTSEAARRAPASLTPAERHWRFEIIDVRLTAGPDPQPSGWLAYGTLAFAFDEASSQANTPGSAPSRTAPTGGSYQGRTRDSRSPGPREGR